MDSLNRIEVHEGKAEVLPKLAYTSNIPTPKHQVHFPKPSGIKTFLLVFSYLAQLITFMLPK